MKRIVCDTGPLIHLEEAGIRDLLSQRLRCPYSHRCRFGNAQL